MKLLKSILYMVCFAAFSIILSCGNSNDKEITTQMLNYPGDDGPKPVMTFDSLAHHFGRVAVGEPVNWTYTLQNTGAGPLVLSQVNASCGCTTIKEWPHDPIEPGKFAQIVVQLNTSNLTGYVRKDISILSNTIPAVTHLELIGEVVGKDIKDKNRQPVEMERTH